MKKFQPNISPNSNTIFSKYSGVFYLCSEIQRANKLFSKYSCYNAAPWCPSSQFTYMLITILTYSLEEAAGIKSSMNSWAILKEKMKLTIRKEF